MKRIVVAGFLSLMLSGCDEGLHFHGLVTSSDHRKLHMCTWSIYAGRNKSLVDTFTFMPPRVEGHISISPNDEPFIAVIRCAEHEPFTARLKYGNAPQSTDGFNIGDVVLNPSGTN